MTDVAWSQQVEWMLASVADDNVLQVYLPAAAIIYDDEDDEDDDDGGAAGDGAAVGDDDLE